MKETSYSTFAIAGVMSILVLTGLSCPSSGGEDGGFYLSFDQAENWEQRVFVREEGKDTIAIDDINGDTLVVDPVDENTLYIGSRESGLFKTVNQGENWFQTGLNTGRVRTLSIDPDDNNIMYATSNTTIIKTTDGGSAWEEILKDSAGSFMTNVLVDSFDPSIIWATAANGTVYKTMDGGNNWQVNYRFPDGARWIAISEDDTRIVYAAVAGDGLYKTTNKGRSWAKDEVLAATKNTGEVLFMEVSPDNKDRVLIVTRHGLMKTTNGGETWEPIETLLGADSPQNEAITAFTTDHKNLIVFSVGNTLHKSTNGGTTWRTVTSFTSSRQLQDLALDPETNSTVYAIVRTVEDEGGGFFITP